MAISLTHTTVAVGTDAGNGEIRKAQWNENHTLTMAGGGTILGRTTAGTGAVEELTEITLASGTKTADAPALNMTQTWNNGAVTFTSLLLNVTNTASASGSKLLNLQLGGASVFEVSASNSISAAYVRIRGGGQNLVGLGSLNISVPSIVVQSTGSFGWSVNADAFSGVYDLILSRRAAANLRLGAADAAAPVPQTLSVQSVVAGTSNTAGANLTITGSQGTGTGAGGSIIFQVAPAGSSPTVQNALANVLQLNGAGGITGWDGTTANTLALRNGTSAQKFRVYNTYTSATSYENYEIDWQTTANIALVGPTKGSGGGTQRVQRLQYLEDGGSGSTTPSLGTTCPAASATIKSWIKVITSDGSTGYIPCWA